MKQRSGFTLIEVLIALAIISIALIAVIKTINVDIRAAERIQQRTLAHWVAIYAANTIQLGMERLPVEKKIMFMLNQNFFWSAESYPTSNPKIQQVTIRVYSQINGTKSDELQIFID